MTHKNLNNRKFFCDMDGVIADFASARDATGLDSMEFKLLPGVYRNLNPYPGAIDNLRKLIDAGWDVWIATKIPNDNPGAATEKLLWIAEHAPFLRKSVIITPNKGTLGTKLDFLIDDRPHKAHCEDFQGKFFRFGFDNEYQTWEEVMAEMALHNPDGAITDEIFVDGMYLPVRTDPLFKISVVRWDEMTELVRRDFHAYTENNQTLTYSSGNIEVALAADFRLFLAKRGHVV